MHNWYKTYFAVILTISIICPCISPSIFWAFSISHFVHLSVFLDLLPWKQTQEHPLLVQDEDYIKKQEKVPEGSLPHRATEEIQAKISIPVPEEQKTLKTCHLYTNIFSFPRFPFLMSFLVILAMTMWWLVFLWLRNTQKLVWNINKTLHPSTSG